MLLLYRALLPTPVWYRFFLNKEYGSFFSSLMTGLYLTFKLTSVVEKVRNFFLYIYIPYVPCIDFEDHFLFMDFKIYQWVLELCLQWYFVISSNLSFSLSLASNFIWLGAILLCCIKSTVTKRSALWGICNIRAGNLINL